MFKSVLIKATKRKVVSCTCNGLLEKIDYSLVGNIFKHFSFYHKMLFIIYKLYPHWDQISYIF